jgi:hypothetical protein
LGIRSDGADGFVMIGNVRLGGQLSRSHFQSKRLDDVAAEPVQLPAPAENMEASLILRIGNLTRRLPYLDFPSEVPVETRSSGTPPSAAPPAAMV